MPRDHGLPGHGPGHRSGAGHRPRGAYFPDWCHAERLGTSKGRRRTVAVETRRVRTLPGPGRSGAAQCPGKAYPPVPWSEGYPGNRGNGAVEMRQQAGGSAQRIRDALGQGTRKPHGGPPSAVAVRKPVWPSITPDQARVIQERPVDRKRPRPPSSERQRSLPQGDTRATHGPDEVPELSGYPWRRMSIGRKSLSAPR